MIRVGVPILRALRIIILRVAILRVREEYLENTPRARTRTRARGERQEEGHETRAGQKARDTRNEGREDHKEEHWECT